jgi:hypothetical protein
MSFRDDMNALYARAETLERDLERAQAELAELRARGGGSAGGVATGDGGGGRGVLASLPAFGPKARERAQHLEPMALDLLDRMHTRSEPPQLAALHEYEDGIGRAIELVVPEMMARHRGVAGDGSHAQLMALLDFLTALWRGHTAGMRTDPGRWRTVESLIAEWQPHNELGRVLRQLADYERRR